MPNLFVIAGPNGAGKTTYARRFLPEEMRTREFVNADLIAAGLSPFAPDQAAYDAGRIMLGRLRELAAQRADFSFETTLSGRAYAPLLKEMRAAGYRIRMDFLWIPQLGIARQRVRQRVAKGGHDIPEEVQHGDSTLAFEISPRFSDRCSITGDSTTIRSNNRIWLRRRKTGIFAWLMPADLP